MSKTFFPDGYFGSINNVANPSCSPSPAPGYSNTIRKQTLSAVKRLHALAGERVHLRGKCADGKEENSFLGEAASFTEDILELVLRIVLAADTPRLSAMTSRGTMEI